MYTITKKNIPRADVIEKIMIEGRITFIDSLFMNPQKYVNFKLVLYINLRKYKYQLLFCPIFKNSLINY